MKKQKINRLTLSKLETSELINLAKCLELFVPPNFSRTSLIGDILECEDELENLSYNDLRMLPIQCDVEQLPASYNMTEIRLLLTGPVWCFAFWDINMPELEKILKNETQVRLFLRVMNFNTENDEQPYSWQDIDVQKEERSCYVQTSSEDEITQVALCYRTKTRFELLAKSNFIYLPRRDIKKRLSQDEKEISDVMRLSGLQHLKLWHFEHFKDIFEY